MIKPICAQQVSPDTIEIFIAKGEQQQISTGKDVSYSVGNHEVLKHIYQKKKNKLLIKGKAIGFSDLIIWQSGKSKKYKIFVSSKRSVLEKTKIVNALAYIGLKAKVIGDLISVSGTLVSLKSFHIFNNLKKKSKFQLITSINLSKKLKNKLLEEIYVYLASNNARDFYCEVKREELNCKVKTASKKLIQNIKNKYYVNISYSREFTKSSNLKVLFKLIEVNKSGMEQFQNSIANNGLDLTSLISKYTVGLFRGQSINIKELNSKLTLLSKSEYITSLNSSSNIRLGNEVLKSTSTDTHVPLSIFNGLMIKSKIERINNKLKYTYSSQLTKAEGEGSKGTKNKSSLYITLNKFYQLATIEHKSTELSSTGIPYLKDLPVIGSIFSSKQKSVLNKQIIALVQIVEIKNE